MKQSTLLVVIMLVIGLIAGAGLGTILSANTVTITETKYSTILSTLTEKTVERITETKAIPTTLYSTATLTVKETSTSTVTKTATSVSTITLATTLTRRVYPSESETVLLADSGSGYKDTRPFTLNETADLKITIKVYPTADLKYVLLGWYLYIPGTEKWVKQGTINQDAGSFEFYAARIPPGDYYVKILAANCKWEVTVEKVVEKTA